MAFIHDEGYEEYEDYEEHNMYCGLNGYICNHCYDNPIKYEKYNPIITDKMYLNTFILTLICVFCGTFEPLFIIPAVSMLIILFIIDLVLQFIYPMFYVLVCCSYYNLVKFFKSD